MSEREKANKLANKFITKSIFDMSKDELTEQRRNAKMHATTCVDEIINALNITTGHCTLKKLDHQEVISDLRYWEGVKKEIDLL